MADHLRGARFTARLYSELESMPLGNEWIPTRWPIRSDFESEEAWEEALGEKCALIQEVQSAHAATGRFLEGVRSPLRSQLKQTQVQLGFAVTLPVALGIAGYREAAVFAPLLVLIVGQAIGVGKQSAIRLKHWWWQRRDPALRVGVHILERGSQLISWVAFAHNQQQTWDEVKHEVEGLLTSEWKKGRLVGDTPEAAFWVKCDESSMTNEDVAEGDLVCEFGYAAERGGEFESLKLRQPTADFRYLTLRV